MHLYILRSRRDIVNDDITLVYRGPAELEEEGGS